MTRRVLFSAVLAGAFAAGGGVSHAGVSVGGEFQVNTYTPAYEDRPDVALLPGGGFVVVWQAGGQEGEVSQYGIFAQRFESTAARLGGEFLVNSHTPSNQSYPRVATGASNGAFVVVWDSSDQDSGSTRGVFGQRFDSAGAKVGVEFQVNSYTAQDEYPAAVAMDAAGDFVVVWGGSGDHDGSFEGIFGQRFASSGAKLGVELQINSYTPSVQRTPSIGVETNGDFVVAWDSYLGSDPDFEIRAQRFDSAGARIGGELMVNSYTPNPQYGAQVAVDADGDFVVAWASFAQIDSTSDIFGQRFSSSGARVGGEFLVNSGAPGDQYFLFPPERGIAIDAAGDFVVAWNSYGQDGSAGGVFAQRFASNGAKVAVEFQVNVHATDWQAAPSVALAAQGGEFVVAWQSRYQDDVGYGVFARRFSFGAAVKILDIDGNGSTGALTDGLLVLRRMFGFTGATLTGGVVGGGCTRCDATAIESYLASILDQLDIDDNGSITALTDGLLVLRRMFGFSGATLTNGVLGSGCMRCDAAAIATFIDGLS